MLKIQNIRKEYITGELKQIALDDVSLDLRDNEFVAILGPSGSGKTTLLNVIGGLDRYDSGDLIINGVSTKQYKDRDWDSYRNHTIGFVFQSYNLIPHQTVLSNVELALTISGISRAERKRRAKEALEKVGLGDQLHKKPNQMSGGQMQRVAIARALVNDPDIVLADEPTGALDTETSVQIMDLLKDVARDRLVVMVTHNPELADTYATRIVKLKDGKIVDDSMPCTEEEIQKGEAVHRNLGHASMSFFTALLLSFNNLRTKKGRTFLTALAGSIGIIGIALIMSLSNGAQTYIDNIEQETLSEYPLTINATNMDFTALMLGAEQAREEKVEEGYAREWQTLSAMFSKVSNNDLASLKAFFEEDAEEMDQYARAIEYSYNITPQIYRLIGTDGYRQVNPDQALSGSLGQNYSAMTTMSMMSMDSFSILPSDPKLYEGQYEVLRGHWPQEEHECVLVLSSGNRVTDMTLYALGLKDADELDKMIEAFYRTENYEGEDTLTTWKLDDFLDIRLKLLDPSDRYTYDEKYKVYVDHNDNKAYMRDVLERSEDIVVVGVVRAKDDDDGVAMLQPGLYCHAGLPTYIMHKAAESEVVQRQLADPETDVFTGVRFGDVVENTIDMSEMFAIDEEGIANAFQFDADSFDLSNLDLSEFDLSGLDLSGLDLSGLDLSGMDGIDLSGLDLSSLDLSDLNVDLADLLKDIDIDIDSQALMDLLQGILEGYLKEAAKDPSTDYAHMGEAMGKYLSSDQARQTLMNELQNWLADYSPKLPEYDTVSTLVRELTQGFITYLSEQEIEDPSQMREYLTAYLATEEVQSRINTFISDLAEEQDLPELTGEDLEQFLTAMYNDYQSYAQSNDLPDLSKLASSFVSYMGSAEAAKTISEGIPKVIDLDKIEKQVTKKVSKTMQDVGGQLQSAIGLALSQALSQIMTETLPQTINSVMAQVMESVTTQLTSAITEQIGQIMEQFAANMQNAVSFDMDAFTGAITMKMDAEQMQELMMSMMNTDIASYEGNLTKLNYQTEATPSMISIFPRDFESKEEIIRILDEYNVRMVESGQEKKAISYTDYVGTLMGSVTKIIHTISIILIAFVAISLIVSSIMIGIITYISVLERTKEIGILRAIGASKRNISQVFNAETFIIGLLAGLLGVGISLLILIPANAIIHSLAGSNDISAILPAVGGAALVVISVILTLIGGLIPSRKAAKKDPVTALRTE